MTSVRTLQIGNRTLDVAFRYQPRDSPTLYDPGSPEGVEVKVVWEDLEPAETTDDEMEEIERQIKHLAREIP